MADVTKAKPSEGVKPDEAAKTVTLKSPWGSKVTVAADQADAFKDAGYSTSKS